MNRLISFARMVYRTFLFLVIQMVRPIRPKMIPIVRHNIMISPMSSVLSEAEGLTWWESGVVSGRGRLSRPTDMQAVQNELIGLFASMEHGNRPRHDDGGHTDSLV